MKVVFHTKHIDRIFYTQIIHQYIIDQLSSATAWRLFKKYKKDWEIHVYPSEDWQGIDGRVANTGTLNSLIPHGMTGEGIVKTYVIDVDDKGLTSLQNFSAILHETAHMLLIMLMRGTRGTFRNDDLSGNKKGAQANVSTQEVHDRQIEKKIYQVRSHINIGNWFIRKWIRYTCIGIDLSDFIQKNT